MKKFLLLTTIAVIGLAAASRAEPPIRLVCDIFNATVHGCVPPSGGGTTKYLRADGQFAVPPGGSSPTLPCTSADSIGFVGDNSTDNVNAWNTWAAGFTNALSGYCLQFGPGWYRFNSAVSIFMPVSVVGNQALAIRGMGSEGTVLHFANGGGITINPLNTFEAKQYHISGLSLWTSGTTGAGLTVTSTITTTLQATIHDIVIRAAGSGKWASGIHLINQGQAYIRDFIISSADIGINLTSSGPAPAGTPGIVIESGSIGPLQKGIYIGNHAQSILVDKMIFNGGNQIWVDGPDFFQLTVSNSVFSGIIPGAGQTNGDGIVMNNAGGVQLVNNLMYCNIGFSCINAQGSQAIVAIGNIFRGWGGVNSNTGITIGPINGTTPSTIVGNSFNNLSTGVNLQSGSFGVNVQSNAYAGNSANVANAGSNTVGGGSP